MLLWKCAICNNKTSRFVKKQETSGLLSNLGLKTQLSKIPLFGDILFCMQFYWITIKLNKIVNKFLLAEDTFMPEIHLKQPEFTYSACGRFPKNKERIIKFKDIGETEHIYRDEPDKACFQYDMAYGDFNNLARRTTSDKAFNTAKNPKYE